MDFKQMYSTYENTIKIYGGFEIPVPTYVIDKKVDFSFLISLLLRSNNNDTEDSRYIEYCKLDKIGICKELGICEKTFNTKIKYLEEVGIITYKNTMKGLVMKINYKKDGKYYVKIRHEILHYMLHNLSDYHIKAYLLLKIQCDVLKNDRPISIAYLCNTIGYSIKSQTNLRKMSKWTNELVEHRFIEKTKIRIYKNNENGKKIIDRVDTYYQILSYENWIKNFKGV